jgi:hypothetical protein
VIYRAEQVRYSRQIKAHSLRRASASGSARSAPMTHQLVTVVLLCSHLSSSVRDQRRLGCATVMLNAAYSCARGCPSLDDFVVGLPVQILTKCLGTEFFDFSVAKFGRTNEEYGRVEFGLLLRI